MKKKGMSKAQVVAHIAGKFDVAKKTVAAMFDELSALAATETKKNGEFTLPGIAKLTLVHRAARKGRNPATNAEIMIPAKTVAKARLTKTFKDAVVPAKK